MRIIVALLMISWDATVSYDENDEFVTLFIVNNLNNIIPYLRQSLEIFGNPRENIDIIDSTTVLSSTKLRKNLIKESFRKYLIVKY